VLTNVCPDVWGKKQRIIGLRDTGELTKESKPFYKPGTWYYTTRFDVELIPLSEKLRKGCITNINFYVESLSWIPWSQVKNGITFLVNRLCPEARNFAAFYPNKLGTKHF